MWWVWSVLEKFTGVQAAWNLGIETWCSCCGSTFSSIKSSWYNRHRVTQFPLVSLNEIQNWHHSQTVLNYVLSAKEQETRIGELLNIRACRPAKFHHAETSGEKICAPCCYQIAWTLPWAEMQMEASVSYSWCNFGYPVCCGVHYSQWHHVVDFFSYFRGKPMLLRECLENIVLPTSLHDSLYVQRSCRSCWTIRLYSINPRGSKVLRVAAFMSSWMRLVVSGSRLCVDYCKVSGCIGMTAGSKKDGLRTQQSKRTDGNCSPVCANATAVPIDLRLTHWTCLVRNTLRPVIWQFSTLTPDEPIESRTWNRLVQVPVRATLVATHLSILGSMQLFQLSPSWLWTHVNVVVMTPKCIVDVKTLMWQDLQQSMLPHRSRGGVNCANQDDCNYMCMHKFTEHLKAHGNPVMKYHGKWPFLRILGFQVSMR